MKSLKDALRKPIILWSLIGALGLGIGTLTFRNIGLKNQNNDLFNKYTEVGKRYSSLVPKYGQTIKDSMEIEAEHFSKILSLKMDNLKLVYKLDSLQESYIDFVKNSIGNYLEIDSERDSLWNDYITFAESSLETAKQRRDLLQKIILITEEKEFYKKYAAYTDSLLLKCESDKMLQDKK
jgi:hypothetical protein